MTYVYVINKHGKALMPCSPRKARLLLKAGKAKVKHRTPFTIQLLYGSSGYTQAVTLGVDAGSKTVGFSAAADGREVFAAGMTPRNDVVNNLSNRREFRRARRGRKTRYRQPRFDNRVRGKHEGWLAPSVETKIQEHITCIRKICGILPVAQVIVETAEFDLQKLKAVEAGLPVPAGEDYQKGEMLGQYNVRQYVLHRDGYTCQCCGLGKPGTKFHVHHKTSRKTGGNAPDNLVTLCKSCHGKVHKGLADLPKALKRNRRSTRDAAFMGIMRKTLVRRLREELPVPVAETHGYVTKYVREQLLKLPKTHVNDALAIALGRQVKMSQAVERSDRQYLVRPVRHHNRQIHKATVLKGGERKRNQAKKYVYGYRLYDKVLYQGQECFVWGRRSNGYFLLRMLDGTKVKDGVSHKRLALLERSSNYLIA